MDALDGSTHGRVDDSTLVRERSRISLVHPRACGWFAIENYDHTGLDDAPTGVKMKKPFEDLGQEYEQDVKYLESQKAFIYRLPKEKYNEGCNQCPR